MTPTPAVTPVPEAPARSLYPCVRYTDAPAAIDWLVDVLGFSVHARYDGPAGTVAHAELVHSGGMLMLGSAKDDDRFTAADAHTPSAACVYLAVDDPAPLFARVRAAGWAVLSELAEQDHGGTEFDCRDPGGVFWGVGSYRP